MFGVGFPPLPSAVAPFLLDGCENRCGIVGDGEEALPIENSFAPSPIGCCGGRSEKVGTAWVCSERNRSSSEREKGKTYVIWFLVFIDHIIGKSSCNPV